MTKNVSTVMLTVDLLFILSSVANKHEKDVPAKKPEPAAPSRYPSDYAWFVTDFHDVSLQTWPTIDGNETQTGHIESTRDS